MATRTISSSTTLAAFGANPGSSGGYDVGDDIAIPPGLTLTVDATPAKAVKGIAATTGGGGKCIITNSSTSTMLKLEFTATLNGTTGYAALNFQNDCELQISGDFINIYTGNGAANQTVLANLNSVGGASVDFLSYIEVEESANVWEKYLLIPEAVANFEASEYSSVHTTGTVSTYTAGTQTVTITGAAPTTVQNQLPGKRFRTASMSEDAVISTSSTATTFVIVNKDGSPYSGATPSGSFTIRDGACFERTDFSSGVMGRVLFLNPITKEVQCGDGVRGNVIGNGMRVRVPNIYIGQVTPTTTIAAGSSIPSSGTASFNLTSATNFPTSNSGYTNSTVRATLLIQDSATTPTVSERIGYTTISGTTVSATGMTRAAYNTLSKAFSAGASVKYIVGSGFEGMGLSRLNLSTGGSIVADTVMFGPGFAFSYAAAAVNFAKKISIKRTGIFGGLASAAGFSGDYIVDSCVFQRDCRHFNDYSLYVGIATVPGITEVKNSVFFYPQNRFSSGSVYSCLLSQNANVAAFENNVGILLRTYQGTHATFGLFSLNNCHIKNNYSVGRFYVSNSANNLIENTYVSSSPSEYTGILILEGAVTLGDYSDNNIVRGIRNIPNTSAYRGQLVYCYNFSSDNIVTNKGYPTYDGTNNLAPATFVDQGTNNIFGFLTTSNSRTGNASMGANAYNSGQKRVRCLVTTPYASPMLALNTGPAPAMESEIDLQLGPQPFSNPANTTFDSQPFVVCTTPGTVNEGYFCAGTFQPTKNWTGIFVGLSQTAYLNGDGALYITGASDAVEIYSKWPMRGISSFDTAGSITKLGTNPDTNALYYFKMSNWGDALPGSWTALTPANLESARAALTGYSTSVGINFAMRVTTSVSSGTRNVRIVRMPIFWDTAYNPVLSSFDLRVSGAISGAQIAVSTDSGTTWPSRYMATSTGSTVTIPIDCDYLGATTTLKVRIRKAGYQVLEYDLTTVDEDVDLPVELVQVVDVTGSAVYGRGHGTTTSFISVVPGSLRVDIGNALVVLEDLYDALSAWQSTATGIAYPEILQFDGTDAIILNSWKLRRNVAGSVDAGTDGLVIFGPSTSASPVDEANGSVRIWARGVRTASGVGISAADVWSYATSSATTSGSMGERLKDASTVATTGAQIAETLG